MALEIILDGVDIVGLLVEDTLRIEQDASSFVSVAYFDILDKAGVLVPEEKQPILIQDGVTKYFEGTVGNVSEINFADGTEKRQFTLECQDYNILVEETVIDDLEEYGAERDDVIIDQLFDKYLPEINSHGPGDLPPGYVEHLHIFAEIEFTAITLREALDRICQQAQGIALEGYWYIDFDKYLHYFNAENDTPGWFLSDNPDGVNSFSYFSQVRRERTGTIINRVLVCGAEICLFRQDYASINHYGRAFEGIVRDNNLESIDEILDRGDSILAKWAWGQVVYHVTTRKAGLRAGMDVRFVNALFNVDATFTVQSLTLSFPQHVPTFELTLGGKVNKTSLVSARLAADNRRRSAAPIVSGQLPLCSRGWKHSLVFSSTDNDTVAWAAGKITTASGLEFDIVGGNTGNMAVITYIYFDLDTSDTQLQTGFGPAVGKNIIMVAVAAPGPVTEDAAFQVFGGNYDDGIGLFLTADNIAANTITANEITANTITATEIAAYTITATQIAVNTITADRLAVGGELYDGAEGLLLLGPNCLITSTSWRSLRLQEATLSGAFHRVAGKWLGTRALLVEAATTNYCTSPRMVDANSDGEADNWTFADTVVGAPTYTVGAHPIEGNGWLQRAQYTGIAGDVAADFQITFDTSAASFAPGDDATFSLDMKGASSGVQVYIYVRALNNVGAVLGFSGTAVTLTSSLKREEITYTNLPANTDKVQVLVRVLAIDNTNTVDLYFGAVNVEKDNVSTTFCCGALAWCAWSGADDASTSTRIKTEVNLDDHVGLLSGNSTATHITIVQAPYDYDDDWDSLWNHVFDLRGADANNRIFVTYGTADNRFVVYMNGATRIEATVTAFNKGDQLHIALTYDYAGYAYLYLNGVQVGSCDISALTAPTGLIEWNLASSRTSTYQGGWAATEYAVYDDVLTRAEINIGHQLSHPTVDVLPADVPGIYIYDGRFRIMSSTSGNRIEITADEIAGYDSAGTKQFYLRSEDGVAMCGAGAVVLHDDGIDIDMGGDMKNRISFMHGAVERGYIWPKAYVTAALLYIRAGLPSAAGHTSNIYLEAVPFTGVGDRTCVKISSKNNVISGNVTIDVDNTFALGVYSTGPRVPTGRHLEFHDNLCYLYRSGTTLCWVGADGISTNAAVNKWKFGGILGYAASTLGIRVWINGVAYNIQAS